MWKHKNTFKLQSKTTVTGVFPFIPAKRPRYFAERANGIAFNTRRAQLAEIDSAIPKESAFIEDSERLLSRARPTRLH